MWSKIAKLLFSPIIQRFKLSLSECFKLFKVVCLLFAEVSCLLHAWFNFTSGRLRGYEVVPRMLQDTNPTQTAHTLSIATVVLDWFFWMVGASIWKSMRDLIWGELDTYWQRLLKWVGSGDLMDIRGPKVVRIEGTVGLLNLEVLHKWTWRFRR